VDRCAECGFSYGGVITAEVPLALRHSAARYHEVLTARTDRDVLGRRPSPEVWSPIEYACHVRDVLLIQRDRAVLALVEDNPSFARMYRDERVTLMGYGEASPAQVADELSMAARLLATLYERIGPEQLARPCVYNFPAPMGRDVAWLGCHSLHEVMHHLWDIETALGRSPDPGKTDR
jgi:DNA segregation ATPase FtsK/SpoIIIE, S-DNA-T family